MRIEIIPCLQDNYSYLIIDESNNFACVVDPSESEPIINFLKNKNIKLNYYQKTQKFIVVMNTLLTMQNFVKNMIPKTKIYKKK